MPRSMLISRGRHPTTEHQAQEASQDEMKPEGRETSPATGDEPAPRWPVYQNLAEDHNDESLSDEDELLVNESFKPLEQRQEAGAMLPFGPQYGSDEAATNEQLQLLLQLQQLSSNNNQSLLSAGDLANLQQQQQHNQQPQPAPSASNDQQVDSLTNAIIYFVNLFNQQQHQQPQQPPTGKARDFKATPALAGRQVASSRHRQPHANPSGSTTSLLTVATPMTATTMPVATSRSQLVGKRQSRQAPNVTSSSTRKRQHAGLRRQIRASAELQRQLRRTFATSAKNSNKSMGAILQLGQHHDNFDDDDDHLNVDEKDEHDDDDDDDDDGDAQLRTLMGTNINPGDSLLNNSGCKDLSNDSTSNNNSHSIDSSANTSLLSPGASLDGKRSSAGSGSGTGDNFVHYCNDCGKRYSTSSNLARHRQTHRDVTDKKAKKCPECDKIYVSMPAFSMHLRTHNQGCICSVCGKSFSRPWLLQGHMRTHTGEKPFKCKICDKAFADKSNLRAHIQTHSTDKPHVCERCNKAFALKSYLCKHVESTCMRANGFQKEPLNLKVLNQPRRGRSSNHNNLQMQQ